MSYNNLGILYHDTQRFTDSEQMYNSALEIYKRLAATNPQAYEPDLAVNYNNLGILYRATQRFIVAETPQDVLTLVKGGVPIRKVNIGNMHMSEGKRQVATSVAVDDADVAAFKELQELGVELEIRRVPSTPVEDISKLFS